MFPKRMRFNRSKHTSSSQRKYPTIIEELCCQFSLADLRKSTNNFDHRCYRGGLYKGILEHNGVTDYAVALRRIYGTQNLYGTQNRRIIEFKKEIELLCQLHHPNLISLIGFYEGKNESILVHEYMSNGSLDRQLERGELSWKKRLEICIGAARGLHYLHAGAKRTIIHRDIKPSNILLDANMEPKISGFGFSVLGQRFMSKPKPIKVDYAAGTLGYMAAEQLVNLTITDKTDVYSFGMVLFEVVSGEKYTKLRMKLLKEDEEVFESPVEEKVDPKIRGKIAPESWQVFIDIMQGCLKYEVDERPTMGEVEVQLEHALSLQEQADITNIHGHYVLLSNTIINLNPEREDENGLSLRQDEDIGITEDSDSEDMFPR